MARKAYNPFETIEYIGPAPKKPARRPIFGGWVIVLLALGIGCFFGRPLLPFLKAQQEGASSRVAELRIEQLASSPVFSDQLAANALRQSQEKITYDPSYYEISYPNGDIDPGKGMCADVIIRAYRSVGVDLQVLVHEDITANLREYNARAADPNIDHRRVMNLAKFFSRHSKEQPITRNAADYKPGDVVTWMLPGDKQHIGIVVPAPTGESGEVWVVHNNGGGVKWEDSLFKFHIIGHHRFLKSSTAQAAN